MKLEVTVKTEVFEGSEVKESDVNVHSDSTLLFRNSKNYTIAASTTKSILPDNMVTVKHLNVTALTDGAKFSLILTDTGGAKTLVDLEKQFIGFGAWTAVSIVTQTSASEFDVITAGV